MTKSDLFRSISEKNSYLCVGLDPDLKKMPQGISADGKGVLEFNKRIVDATHDIAVAYKPNMAYYLAMGMEGMDVLAKTMEFLPKDTFNIADAKCSDVGHTAKMYAQAYFETMGFDGVTLNPVMGFDSVQPFLEYEGKFAVSISLGSNPGSNDFLQQRMSGWRLYQRMMLGMMRWGNPDNVMFVVGGTNNEQALTDIRHLAEDNFFLVPGVGAQGGDLAMISRTLMNKEVGIIVNASRSILYADSKNFEDAARKAAQKLQKEMAKHLQRVPA